MYTKLLFSTLFVLLTNLSAFSQCPTDIIKVGRKLAKDVAFKTMKKISPNTGKDEDATLKGCRNDQLNGVIIFDVELTWSALTQMIGGDSGQCVVWGEIKISDEDQSEFKFVTKDMNSFAKRCADSRKWDGLEAFINASMNSRGGN
jgi:hypothetical protein